MLLVQAGLPEPEVNGRILDERGRFVAECDLVYRQARVIIEIGLAPAQPWDDAIAVFGDLDSALGCANELAHANEYTYQVLNDDLDAAVRDLTAIIRKLF